MKPPLNAKVLAPLVVALVLLSAPTAMAEIRVVVAEDGTIQFVQVVEGAVAEVPASAASVGSEAALAPPAMGAVAEAGVTGSAAATPVTGSSVVASPSTSASAVAKPGASGSALAHPGEAAAAEAEPGDDRFAEAPRPPVIVLPEEAEDPITVQFNACQKISFGDTVLFDTAKHDLKRHAGPALDAVAKVLLAQPSIRVRIEGHTDSRGGIQYNQALSERRANAVYRAFLRRGVPSRRLEVVGYGLTQPADTNNTAAGRAKNRRVDLVPLNCR